MSEKPDPMAQFRSDEIDQLVLLGYINNLQLAVIQLQTLVFDLRQREIELGVRSEAAPSVILPQPLTMAEFERQIADGTFGHRPDDEGVRE